jgi:site-specific recombinase XerD
VMRHASNDSHGWRLRAMIVMLWRGGLRVQEALALSEQDLDSRRGSVLVRRGKGGRRREVGMDAWGWENLRPWLSERLGLPTRVSLEATVSRSGQRACVSSPELRLFCRRSKASAW